MRSNLILFVLVFVLVLVDQNFIWDQGRGTRTSTSAQARSFSLSRVTINIDKAFGPTGGQHGTDCRQSQRRAGRSFVNKLLGMLKTPEGVWKGRVSVQGIH